MTKKWRTSTQVALIALALYVASYLVIVRFSYRETWPAAPGASTPEHTLMGFGLDQGDVQLLFDPTTEPDAPVMRRMRVLYYPYWPLLKADTALTGVIVLEPDAQADFTPY